jgi:hypothetical protein
VHVVALLQRGESFDPADGETYLKVASRSVVRARVAGPAL